MKYNVELAFWLTVAGTICWVICFWWMHRISSRQNALLESIHSQSKRLEELSRAQHELMKEVHPQVSEIKEGVQQVTEAVKEKENGGDRHRW